VILHLILSVQQQQCLERGSRAFLNCNRVRENGDVAKSCSMAKENKHKKKENKQVRGDNCLDGFQWACLQ
jgi:hypothetical protein